MNLRCAIWDVGYEHITYHISYVPELIRKDFKNIKL